MHLTNTSKNWKQLAFNILLSHNTLTGEGTFHSIMKMFNPNTKVQHRQSRGQKLCYISLFLCQLWNIFEPFSGTKHLSTSRHQTGHILSAGIFHSINFTPRLSFSSGLSSSRPPGLNQHLNTTIWPGQESLNKSSCVLKFPALAFLFQLLGRVECKEIGWEGFW